MNRIFHSFLIRGLFLISMLSIFPAHAQEESWRADVDRIVKEKIEVKNSEGVNKSAWVHFIEMKNGRKFRLDHNLVIEYPGVDDAIAVRNVFDFDNGLVFHLDPASEKQLTVTPFAQMAPGRTEYVRNIGCLAARQSGDGSSIYSNKESYDFYKRYCKNK